MGEVRRIDVPGRARELAQLDRIDYADCFEVDVTTARPPIAWVRMSVGSMPSMFSAVRFAHRALGLRLADDDADHIFGWHVTRSTQTEGVLAADGLLGHPRIVGMTSPGTVVLATLIELNGLTGRSLWTPTAPVHRAVAQRILGRLPLMTPAVQ